MGKIFFKDALVNIKKRIISWLSIVSVIFIGVSGMVGIRSSSYALNEAGEHFYGDHNFRDYDLISNMGARIEDVETIEDLDFITEAEGMINIYGQAVFGEETKAVKILSKTEKISVPYAVEGRLPENKNEIAINPELSDALGVKIGDQIYINSFSTRYSDVLPADTGFTITGFAYHPDYLEKYRANYCIVTYDAFNMEDVFCDYTDIYANLNGVKKYDIFDDGYSEMLDSYIDELREVTDDLSTERDIYLQQETKEEYDSALEKINEKLLEAEEKYQEGRQEYEDKVEEGQEKLDESKKELEDAKKKVNEELAEGLQKLNDGKDEYNTKVAEGESELAKAKADLEKELQDAKWKLFSTFLSLDKAEKLLNEKEGEYSQGMEMLYDGEKQLAEGKQKLDEGKAQFEAALAVVAEVLDDDTLNSLGLLFMEMGDLESAEAMFALTELGPYDRAIKFRELYNSNDAIREVILLTDPEVDELVNSNIAALEEGKKKLDESETEYNSLYQQYLDGKELLEDARKQLDQAWTDLHNAKIALRDGETAYDKREPEARAELAKKEEEFNQKKEDGAKELEEAEHTYNSKKSEAYAKIKEYEDEYAEAEEEFTTKKEEGQEELIEAEQKYNDAKEEAEQKIQDLKEFYDDLRKANVKWVVQTRQFNLSYMAAYSQFHVLANFFIYFLPLYMIIIILVVYYTITVMVEEQKSEIGISMAFGMIEKQIRKKYLIFGVSASVFGGILGLFGAKGFQYIFLYALKDDYAFGPLPWIMDKLPATLILLGSFILTYFVTTRACRKLLKCSAVGLINGSEPKHKTINSARKNSGGNVYFHLIINNIYTEMGRCAVSTLIILVSCLMIGLGFTVRNAFHGALAKQENQVWNYDMKVILADDITKEDEEKVKEVLKDYEYLTCCLFDALITVDNKQIVCCGLGIDDPEEYKKYHILKDLKHNDIKIPDDGVIITTEMAEKNDLVNDTQAKLITPTMDIGDITVRDDFVSYFEKDMIMTKAYYKEIFGEDLINNDYLVRVSDAEKYELGDKLTDIEGVGSITYVSELAENNNTILRLFDALVVVIILLAIVLTLMVLLNLSNILVLHRMRELLTMRINGFSNYMVVTYLLRETLLTTSMGIILGISAGIPFSSFIIKKIETSGVMFDRGVYPLAWVISTVICTIFSVVINTIAFRNINKAPLTDVNKY